MPTSPIDEAAEEEREIEGLVVAYLLALQAGRRPSARRLELRLRRAVERAIERSGVTLMVDEIVAGLLRDVDAAVAVRPFAGITRKQSARIALWAQGAEASGLSRREIAAGVRDRIRNAARVRARALASRTIAIAVNRARHERWTMQIRLGLLPSGTRKQWVTQHDSRVRDHHRRQEAMGPIPWHAPYPIFGVQHPPAPEWGCRCYERVRRPAQVA